MDDAVRRGIGGRKKEERSVQPVKLSVNVDHVATLREARKIDQPDPVLAAGMAELAGADGVTIHLRGDRRHIKERDLEVLRRTVKTHLNVEMAATQEMLRIACELRPDMVTLVPSPMGLALTLIAMVVSAKLTLEKVETNAPPARLIPVAPWVRP